MPLNAMPGCLRPRSQLSSSNAASAVTTSIWGIGSTVSVATVRPAPPTCAGWRTGGHRLRSLRRPSNGTAKSRSGRCSRSPTRTALPEVAALRRARSCSPTGAVQPLIRHRRSRANRSWRSPSLPAAALAGKTALSDLSADAFAKAVMDLVPWGLRQRLDAEAPAHFAVPSGSRVPIDYAAEEGPKLAVRVQELFGLDRHPAIAGGRVPLVLELLSP